MNKSQLKVSFEVTDIYNREDFRILINRYLKETDILLLYIVSQSTDSDYIQKVANALEIDSDKIITCTDTDDKITQIENNQIDIHFDNIESTVEDIDDQTSCEAIYVSQRRNHNFDMKYIKQFERIFKDLTN